jgi:anion-transporting  ArsA/GET3 family ATPase
MKEILVLGKVKALQNARAADVIVVDGPAAGHAVTFLLSPKGLLDAVRVGPILTQAIDVTAMLADPARAQVMLVTLPEETPVNELTETAFSLEDSVGIGLGPVVVNGIYPPLESLDVDPEEAARDAGVHLQDGDADALRLAASFRSSRSELQQVQLDRLTKQLPLPQLRLPLLFTSDLGRADAELLAERLLEQIEQLP